MKNKITKEEVLKNQAKQRASRIDFYDADDFLKGEITLSRNEELLLFKKGAGIVDEEFSMDYENMQTLFDKVA